MAYQPVIPMGGLVGWSFLQRTLDRQATAHSANAEITRDTDYFAARIGEIDSAEELVADRRLLRVALGAFGLQDDIDNRYYIRRMLEDGTLNSEALANRVADDRYREMSRAFGFGDFDTPRSKLSDFPEMIVKRYRERSFEVAVGDQDEALRLALNAQRELATISSGSGSETTKWLKVMGNAPLREVFETALGFPAGFGQLDLDKQVEMFRDKASRQLGSDAVSALADEAAMDRLIQKYLVRSEIGNSAGASAGSVALTLLQSATPLQG